MANSAKDIKQQYEAKKGSYQYPSRFGSHTSMINADATAQLQDSEQALYCVCTDEFGDYRTLRERLNSGLSDPNRSDERRLKSLLG